MFCKIRNLLDNKNIIQTEKMGCFTVFEHQEDLSVVPTEAPLAYFMRQMNCKNVKYFVPLMETV